MVGPRTSVNAVEIVTYQLRLEDNPGCPAPVVHEVSSHARPVQGPPIRHALLPGGPGRILRPEP